MVKNLKMLRTAKGISQKQLADTIGVSQQAVNKYENHGSEPDIEGLIALAEFFNTSVDYLIGYSEVNRKNQTYVPTELSQDELFLINCYRNLSESEKESINLVISNYLK